MKLKKIISIVSTCAVLSFGQTAYTEETNQKKAINVLYDAAHNPFGLSLWLHERNKNFVAEANIKYTASSDDLHSEDLKNTDILFLHSPLIPLSDADIELIGQYIKDGGSLLLLIDEDRRSLLDPSRVNELIARFDMQFTDDLPYLHNAGAISTAGAVTKKKYEVPFSGGRGVIGGTPFAHQLGKDGAPIYPYGAYAETPNGGKIIVLGEIMPALILGEADAERLSGELYNPRKTHYWGKDSQAFMTDIYKWLAE